MLEEKNDNLQEADGKLEIDTTDSTQTDASIETTSAIEPENATTVSENEPENASADAEHQEALDAIINSNAEESEDETLKERHDIPMQDYDTFTLDALVDELKKLVNTDKVMSVKDHIEEIKKSFSLQFTHLLDEKREEFNASNQDPNEEFEYHSPLKSKFDEYYNVFREKRNAHFKHLQTNLKSNLENRLAIVEELKELINPQENIKDTLKHFNDLRERWKNAGPIPKDKYNHVWNNYHFHVENFYDYLHLDREARDLDFKYNLEQKQKIIARVEALVEETDISKAFRELQDLHRIWKEDIGPVSKEHRDVIWNRFSELTKKIHDKREVLFESQRANEQKNLEVKKEIITKIEVLATEKVNAHSQWLVQIQKVEALRNEFFAAGKVPSEVNEETWAAFKTAVRNFNSFKNSFYKDIKKDQNDNLNKKMALVAKAKELQESTDFGATTPIMKQIQEEWKQIGHVPKKYSDKIWKEFKDACNHYFDKLKEHKSEENVDEVAAFDNKKAYLDILRAYQLTGDHKTDLDAIKQHIEIWKGYGKVPFGRRHIEGKFNKILDALFEKLSLSKKETEMMRFSNRIDSLSGSNDTRKLDNEKIFLMRKIEEVQNEIFQLENNIQFFTNTKNAKKENSIVLEVRKNIAIHKESLDVWKDKLKQLRNLGQE
ncbi:DUF349 domain-containing protein [Flavobacterium sp. GA093]|uniref:DUF349 domain-containing protein n=1 Tax=Flavobacterium hydrocarbonoxydans TaxID=2683249 RepID=A0A6I4NK31_9FLAO|nr:DUF349 domain-containing protein [Flavobacterium hydrocarbonoxydans]MWB94856.1 DUF349 domain-containing protein [Flavobacterium hydrocarbonoxydans]